MAYQISYGQDAVRRKKKWDFRLPKLGRLAVARIFTVAVIVILLGTLLIPQVRVAVRDALLPGDPQVTASALERLAESLGEGEALQTALSDFCREIIGDGLQTA